ncbi:acyltransferase [Bacillus sp. BGMRC 2118]|nr:acyltransferase [Bacillus sp. BGMRC 2118]
MIKTIKFHLLLTFLNTFLTGTRFFILKRSILNCIGINVGKGSCIVGPIKVGRIAKLEIGKDCWIGANFTVHGNGKVKINNNCDIGPDVTIITGSHEIGSKERRAGKGVTWIYNIGSGTWIGAKATISNGSNIGNGVVIGACSLITKDCEDNSLYLGSPAKKVKELEII